MTTVTDESCCRRCFGLWERMKIVVEPTRRAGIRSLVQQEAEAAPAASGWCSQAETSIFAGRLPQLNAR